MGLRHTLGGFVLQVPVSQVELASTILADVEMTSRPRYRHLMLLAGVLVLAWASVPLSVSVSLPFSNDRL